MVRHASRADDRDQIRLERGEIAEVKRLVGVLVLERKSIGCAAIESESAVGPEGSALTGGGASGSKGRTSLPAEHQRRDREVGSRWPGETQVRVLQRRMADRIVSPEVSIEIA